MVLRLHDEKNEKNGQGTKFMRLYQTKCQEVSRVWLIIPYHASAMVEVLTLFLPDFSDWNTSVAPMLKNIYTENGVKMPFSSCPLCNLCVLCGSILPRRTQRRHKVHKEENDQFVPVHGIKNHGTQVDVLQNTTSCAKWHTSLYYFATKNSNSLIFVCIGINRERMYAKKDHPFFPSWITVCPPLILG